MALAAPALPAPPKPRPTGTLAMQVDTIRALFTYLTALAVVLGGFAILFAIRAEANSKDLIAIVAGFIGFALNFLFGSEVQARTARQSTAATLAAHVSNGGAPT